MKLEQLVIKWRRCAQKAAERVFVDVRNRIDNMGGYREYMLSQKRRMTWDDDSQGQSPHGSQDDQGLRDQDEEVEIEDEFTMEIMLKMVGVDEKLIGWDRDLTNFKKT